jgi:uncharacterized protein YgiM (DUF1202 family)
MSTYYIRYNENSEWVPLPRELFNLFEKQFEGDYPFPYDYITADEYASLMAKQPEVVAFVNKEEKQHKQHKKVVIKIDEDDEDDEDDEQEPEEYPDEPEETDEYNDAMDEPLALEETRQKTYKWLYNMPVKLLVARLTPKQKKLYDDKAKLFKSVPITKLGYEIRTYESMFDMVMLNKWNRTNLYHKINKEAKALAAGDPSFDIKVYINSNYSIIYNAEFIMALIKLAMEIKHERLRCPLCGKYQKIDSYARHAKSHDPKDIGICQLIKSQI